MFQGLVDGTCRNLNANREGWLAARTTEGPAQGFAGKQLQVTIR